MHGKINQALQSEAGGDKHQVTAACINIQLLLYNLGHRPRNGDGTSTTIRQSLASTKVLYFWCNLSKPSLGLISE